MMDTYYKYKVCIRCITYNHALYIKDAMKGFCEQETRFPFVCIIIDDNSSDGEQDIITHFIKDNFDCDDSGVLKDGESKDYKLLHARHKKNKNCSFVVYFLKYNHYQSKKSKRPYFQEWTEQSQYVAMCEGDDYWIDPFKLQRQVDFMDSHLNHSLCVHAYRKDIMKESGVEALVVKNYNTDIEAIPAKDVLRGTGMFAATASMLYRSEAVNHYPEWAKRAPVGDRPLQLVLLSWGPIGYLKDVMSVYRVGVTGSWTLRVHRDKINNRMTEKSLVQMYKDFDNWTDGRYHSMVRKGLWRFRLFIFRITLVNACRDFIRKVRGIF